MASMSCNLLTHTGGLGAETVAPFEPQHDRPDSPSLLPRSASPGLPPRPASPGAILFASWDAAAFWSTRCLDDACLQTKCTRWVIHVRLRCGHLER